MNRRKELQVADSTKTKSPDILFIEDMVLKVKDKALIFYFFRFKYNGVPNTSHRGNGEFHSSLKLVDMNRDAFIREIFNLVKDDFTATPFNYLKRMALYIRYLDENKILARDSDFFHSDLTHNYINSLNKDAIKGINESKPSVARKAIAFFLKKMGRKFEAQNLPRTHQKKSNINGYDLEFEIKPIAKLLFKGFSEFRLHLKAGTHPEIHPFYDKNALEDYSKSQKWENYKLLKSISAFRLSINPLPNLGVSVGKLEDKRRLSNHLTRVAIMICFMLTGINTEPLLLMRRRDVKFKQIQGDRYLFNTVKGRADNQLSDNGIGFSRRTKEFVEQWLELSMIINGDPKEDWLFPFIDLNNNVSNFVAKRTLIYTPLNKLLSYYGLPLLSAQRFRQTKSDTLMKVTESLFMVSMSLNNSMKTVGANYSSGQKQDHERNLSATMNANMLLAKGEAVKHAVSESKHKFKDIISDYDYKNKRIKANKTPSGIRCENDNNKKNEIARGLGNIKIDIPDEEKKCTNFLECFKCENHVLVALVDDIWLMLSFSDVIKSLKESTAINSIPKKDLYYLEHQIHSILERFKKRSAENYKLASDKHRESSHPLYSDIRSLDDLLGVFS